MGFVLVWFGGGCLFVFRDRVCLHSPDYPGTHYVNMPAFNSQRSIFLSILDAGIIGLHHHTIAGSLLNFVAVLPWVLSGCTFTNCLYCYNYCYPLPVTNFPPLYPIHSTQFKVCVWLFAFHQILKSEFKPQLQLALLLKPKEW